MYKTNRLNAQNRLFSPLVFRSSPALFSARTPGPPWRLSVRRSRRAPDLEPPRNMLLIARMYIAPHRWRLGGFTAILPLSCRRMRSGTRVRERWALPARRTPLDLGCPSVTRASLGAFRSSRVAHNRGRPKRCAAGPDFCIAIGASMPCSTRAEPEKYAPADGALRSMTDEACLGLEQLQQLHFIPAYISETSITGDL